MRAVVVVPIRGSGNAWKVAEPTDPPARVQEREDVGMLQLGGDFDLAEEAVFTQRRGELRPEYLHRDPAVVLHVLGEVDGGHPPTAELALDRVIARKGRPHAF